MTYTDLYLRTEAKANVTALLTLEEDQVFENYFENDLFIIDWIGQIPTAFDEEGNVASWAEGLHFNVYAKPGHESEVNLLFTHFERAFPYTPFRRLAKEKMNVELELHPFPLVYENINKFNVRDIVGPFGEEGDLKVEVFYKFRRTGEEYRIKDVEESSLVMPYTLAPGLDIVSILSNVKSGTATPFEYGVINSILQQFNEAITVVS